MRTLYLVLILCAFVASQAPPQGRISETIKGKLEEIVKDYVNQPPKYSYTIRTEQNVVDLDVKDPKWIDLLPGTVVRAPVVKDESNSYKLISYVRPMQSDTNQNVGSGGVEGLGMPLLRIKSDAFIRRIHPDGNEIGFSHHLYNTLSHSKMSTQAVNDRSLVVALFNFRSKRLPASVTYPLVLDWIFDGADSVDKLYKECTGDQLRFPKSRAVIAPRIYTINDPIDSQSTGPWLDSVQRMATQAVAQDGIDPRQADHFIMILPSFSSADDGASGLANVGPECGRPCPVWINAGLYGGPYFVGGISTVGHELGHNLGWLHSGVPADGGYKVPRPGSSIEAEYGDWSGLMGNGPPICPALPNQLAKKWITATEMISSSKLASLSPLGSPKSGTLQGLIVLTSPTTYISYRAITGPDNRFKSVDTQGRGPWSNAIYVHVEKEVKGTTAIAKIAVGETFNRGSYAIKFVSISPDGVAQVCVSINGVPCPSSGSGGSGGSGGGSSGNSVCAGNPCGVNGECLPQVGSFVCQCKPGFVGPKCQSPVCSSLTVSGIFGSVSFLNGVWQRTSDYAGRVSYVKDNVYLYYVPSSSGLWVFGPDDGGSNYYLTSASNADTPQFLTSWSGNGITQRLTISCGGSSGGSGGGVSRQDCVGSWGEWSTCNPYCNGYQTRTYRISKPASGGGAICPAMDGQTEQKPCGPPCNSSPGVSCLGFWGSWGSCSASCGGGIRDRRYYVTTPASNGGSPCPARDGQVETERCNTQTCFGGGGGSGGSGGAGGVVLDCVGIWADETPCSSTCEKTARYRITQLPVNGGKPCLYQSGAISRWKCTGGLCRTGLHEISNTQSHSQVVSPAIVLISAFIVATGIVVAAVILRHRRSQPIKESMMVLI